MSGAADVIGCVGIVCVGVIGFVIDETAPPSAHAA